MDETKRLTVLFVILLAGGSVCAFSDDPVQDAKRITACFLVILDSVVVYPALAWFIIGGLTYITAAEDRKQTSKGKRYMIEAIAGVACAKALIAIAALTPFGIKLTMCT